MRYYLDTNIVVDWIIKEHSICKDVETILDDVENQFYISSIVAKELIHLQKIGKVSFSKKGLYKSFFEFFTRWNIEIIPFNEKHVLQYYNLEISGKNRDSTTMPLFRKPYPTACPLYHPITISKTILRKASPSSSTAAEIFFSKIFGSFKYNAHRCNDKFHLGRLTAFKDFLCLLFL
jgi:PIN domain nuclease of toxin-antitoxin system